MKNEITTGYTFDEKMHAHKLDGKPLMGVTTVLSVISKPMLIQWAANMACDYIESKWADGLAIEEISGILKEARSAHRKKKEKAGDWGTTVHKWIEQYVLACMAGHPETASVPLDEPTQRLACTNFMKWTHENNVEFLESEKHVWSKELWIGGIVDLVFKMNGKKYIGDIKTSSGIYNEAFFQMGAYDLCLREMDQHNDVEGYLVINLKKDGSMDQKLAENMEINRQAFKHALGLHQIINSLQ